MQLFNNIGLLISLKLLYMCGFIKASSMGIKLGRGAKIHPKAKLKGVKFIGNAQIARSVSMGEGSYINSGIVTNAEVGRYVSIAYNVIIGPTEHNTHLTSMSPYSPKLEALSISSDLPIRKVIIEDEVWIGANAVILQGIVVGYGSIIAAGAVVTKNIPPMEIWGGVPAKKIKNRLIDSHI